jgi:hypothetical protein
MRLFFVLNNFFYKSAWNVSVKYIISKHILKNCAAGLTSKDITKLQAAYGDFLRTVDDGNDHIHFECVGVGSELEHQQDAFIIPWN